MTEAKVQPTAISHPRQRASTWARNLDLADQTVPTPEYPVANSYLLVCLFIYFLSSFCCTFPPGQNALTGGSCGSSPGPLSTVEQEGPHLGSIQLGFTSCLPCLCHILSPLASHLTTLDVVCLGFFSFHWNITALPDAKTTLSILKSSLETHVFHYFPTLFHKASFWPYLCNRSQCWQM